MKNSYKGKYLSLTGMFVIVVVVLVIALSGPTNSESNYLHFYRDKNYVEGEMLVMLKKNVDVNEFISKHDNIGLTVKEPVIEEYNLWLVQFDKTRSESVDALISMVESPDVEIAQFNHYVKERQTFPDDTRFNEMWDMHNTGQSGGTVDADIDAPEAWDITTGGLTAQGDTIICAVIDGGFYLNHADVNFWKNWGEIPGNSIDDDSNGYVDDVNGWNGFNDNGSITASGTHGTHVSGTVGARGNNNLGVTGVNWNVKVMAVQGGNGLGTEAVVLKCYRYVQRQRQLYNQTNGQKGAYVVSTNSSFGVDFGQPANFPLWCAYYDSLGAEGILSAGAGPNLGIDIDVQGDVPTTCPSYYMIAVTNTTRTDQRNSGAGYGPINMDIGAPGTTILSTTSASNYGTSTGTSMATPHVCGAVGLMYAAADPSLIALSKTDPDSVAALMKMMMMENVDSLASLSNILSKGRLNLYKSVLAASTITAVTVNNNVTPESYKLSQNYPNPFNPATNIEFSIPVKGFVSLKIYDITGREVAQLVNTHLYPGLYTANFDASRLSSGVYFYTLRAEGFTQTKKMLLVK
ncbi:MAG: S8 family peptidase [Ignavibacteriae bacterium]|nr:S8 family peptidase [Ignavibacteriota bacterium]